MNKGEFDKREKAIINLKSDTFPQFGEMSMFNDGDLRTANVRSIKKCTVARLNKTVCLIFVRKILTLATRSCEI